MFVFVFDTGIDTYYYFPGEYTVQGDEPLSPGMSTGTLLAKTIREQCSDCNIVSIRFRGTLPKDFDIDNMQSINDLHVLSESGGHRRLHEGLFAILHFKEEYPNVSIIVLINATFKKDDQAMRTVITHLHKKKVVIVAPVGDDNKDVAVFPAAYEGVIGVAAGRKKHKGWRALPYWVKADYSNYGATVDFACLGEMVYKYEYSRRETGAGFDITNRVVKTRGAHIAAARVTGVLARKGMHSALSIDTLVAQVATNPMNDDVYYQRKQMGRGMVSDLREVNPTVESPQSAFGFGLRNELQEETALELDKAIEDLRTIRSKQLSFSNLRDNTWSYLRVWLAVHRCTSFFAGDPGQFKELVKVLCEAWGMDYKLDAFLSRLIKELELKKRREEQKTQFMRAFVSNIEDKKERRQIAELFVEQELLSWQIEDAGLRLKGLWGGGKIDGVLRGIGEVFGKDSPIRRLTSAEEEQFARIKKIRRSFQLISIEDFWNVELGDVDLLIKNIEQEHGLASGSLGRFVGRSELSKFGAPPNVGVSIKDAGD